MYFLTCVLSLFLHLICSIVYVYVCACECVFSGVIMTEIAQMRRSTRKKNPKVIKDFGAIRQSRATGKCITKKTHQDRRVANTATERAVRGLFFVTHFVSVTI